MAFEKNTKMFFISGIDNLRDPVRNTRWRLKIPAGIFTATGIKPTNGLDFGVGEAGTDDFALHVDSCDIPSIDVKTDDLNWMGFKSAYPTGADISADIKFKTKMLEDFRAYEAVLAWEQNMVNTGLLTNNSDQDRVSEIGLRLGLGQHKDILNPTSTVLRNNVVKVEMYNWMLGQPIAVYTLVNAFPKNVGGFTLEHASEGKLVSFDFTLHCDRWSVYIPENYSTGLGQ